MFRPRLTPHQREVLLKYAQVLDRKGSPVMVERVGSRGAINHLVHKGYVEVENRPGPRGGKHLYVTKVHTGNRR